MTYSDYLQWKMTPLTAEPHLSVVIPAYNEEERIVPTIGVIAAHVSTLGFPWELIIADDGSKDVFVHHSSIEAEGFRTLAENAKVEFETEEGPKGPAATGVKPL